VLCPAAALVCVCVCVLPEVDAKKESLMGSISRADVAAVCVEALTNPAAKVSHCCAHAYLRSIL